MGNQIKINELVLNTELWNRDALDEEAVERYMDNLDQLPPIIVEKATNIVLDGWHRIESHKRAGITEIEVIYEECPDHLLKARGYALNATHGIPVSNKHRDAIIVSLRQPDNGFDPLSEEDIAQQMNLSQPRVAQILIKLLGPNNFITQKDKVHEAIRLFLKGQSHREIATQFGVSQPTISTVIRDYTKRKDLIAQHLKQTGNLKSIVQYPDHGPWGDPKFRGNCSGYLLVDLINHFSPASILDPMEGSGTTGDVAFDMGDIPYTGLDLASGFDLVAEKPESQYDFIFWHPPYYKAINYDIPHTNNLSTSTGPGEHINKLKACFDNLIQCLSPQGHLCILYGDFRENGRVLPIHTSIINFAPSLIKDILIKRSEGRARFFDYGVAPFIPITHEYLMVFEK